MKHSRSKNSEKKAAFRRTKEWIDFRKKIFEQQCGIDIITGKKLRKGYNVHHLDMTAENYNQLNEENFIAVNKTTHTMIHDLFRYYKKDPSILEKLETILKRMKELNN